MVMGDLVREVDVAVVGGGPGGYTAAFRCAELGLETVIVDADQRLGGVCLHDGCIPSKALLHVAAVIHETDRAREFGLEFGERRLALPSLRAWKAERVIGKLAKGLAAAAKARGVDVVGGRAMFADARALRVEGEEPQVIRFGHAIVATGSLPARPPGIALASDRVMDSSLALELADVPDRLLVVGGGYVGLEIGTIYAALGSAVTLVEVTDGLLPGVDRDLVQPLARQVGKLFRAVHLNTKVTDVRESGSAIEAEVSGQGTLTVDRILVAVGRRARSDDLGLETTRARIGEDGVIAVDERCRTAEPRIYAVGDITGEPMLAHRAMRQGKVAAEAIAGRATALDNLVVPAVVFTDPEVGWCGLSEQDARRTGRPVAVGKFVWAASGRAASLGRADGLTKLLVDPDSGRLLGAGIVGPGAGELIAEAALAIECGLLAEDVASTIHAHPTLAETVMEAAESLGVRGRHTAPR
jgi:dihydrolipoamide dehydrogenase